MSIHPGSNSDGRSKGKVRPEQPQPKPIRIPDYEKPLPKTGKAHLWPVLKSGDRVEIYFHENYSRTGVIDVLTLDGTTVWVILDSGMGRIALTKGDVAELVLL